MVRIREIKKLTPEFKEIRTIDLETGRVDSIITSGEGYHYHSWIDPSKGVAGGHITKEKRRNL